jgi:hypothetical protein
MAERLRRAIREHRFEDELRVLIRDAIQADEFVEGAEFLLVRNPEIGTQIAENSPVWFLPMAPVSDRQIALFYTFDDATVWLLSIQIQHVVKNRPAGQPPQARTRANASAGLRVLISVSREPKQNRRALADAAVWGWFDP